VYIQPKIDGLFDGCDDSLVDDCGSQFASYSVGRMSHFGNHSSSRYVDMSPWAGVTGISSMGWYWRTKSAEHGIDGAPSSFTLNNYQMARDSFVVLAVAYPADTIFSFNLDMYGSNNVFNYVAMSPIEEVFALEEQLLDLDDMDCAEQPWYSMCTTTGGEGFKWHFDGEHLYLRIVPFSCYNRNRYSRYCPVQFYEAFGTRVWGIDTSFALTVDATCAGCAIQSTLGDVQFYEVPDRAPPFTIAEMQNGAFLPSALPSGEPTNTFPPTETPTLVPTLSPTLAPVSYVLFLDDDFQSLDGWEFDLDGSTASLELVPYETEAGSNPMRVAAASETYVAYGCADIDSDWCSNRDADCIAY
jgi:hypothetical protein